jgi:all-trans-8'-apo-beta-carotenal 15,15'-oxygenase
MFTRRQVIRMMSRTFAGITLSGSAIALNSYASDLPELSAASPLAPDRKWLAKLGEGLPQEFDYPAEIEGRLPNGLSGTLYRNGPGRFDRDGFRKWTLFDGDGMIRATSFASGRARFATASCARVSISPKMPRADSSAPHGRLGPPASSSTSLVRRG